MTSVAVLGAGGFIGGETLRLLSSHPGVDTVIAASNSRAGTTIGDVVRGIRNSPIGERRFTAFGDLPPVDVAISAMPNGALPERLTEILAAAKRVVNVAGDFRLTDPAEIARHYPASSSVSVENSYYVPEFESTPTSRVVSLPGCMAVATQYALMPLYRSGIVEGTVVVEAKTGSSGAGEGGESHSQRYGDVRMHRFFGHRHEPEIVEAVGRYSGSTADLRFSTVSLPISRGVFASVYARLRPGTGIGDVRRAYADAYRGHRFVRMRNGRSAESFPSVNTVLGTNFAEVGVAVRGSDCVAVCALDNLIKGGAGQAVQAMNNILGLPEDTGLLAVARWP